MSQEHELSSGSDDDDEDYVPAGEDCESVSEVESEGDAESAPEDENDENKVVMVKGKSKKLNTRDKSKKGRRKKKKLFIGKDSPEIPDTNDVSKKILTEEEEKKKADLLWADFKKDTGTVSREKPAKLSNTNRPTSPVVRPKTEEKVKITKIFEFAGEEVKIEKEVSVDSAEARLSLPSVEKSTNESESSIKGLPNARGAKRMGLGGLSSVLGQLGKKAKISTLEKSKLDWDSFKREEKLDEEINTHNRGKDGYLDRQDFLQRADVRRFEIEKQMRLSRRGTR
ncbi:craniofacial development protein 1 [Venturia canescens]|uniref:craniofacial development protein 1 n=1 Tax=Venturia canescens TaxID=32260 RepID=UPI001C9CEEDF|nr:craniofacial development protein 1 [Venturia canescens]XP_043289920.1 craniofacial development protein 1 [Venturia canescens]